MESFVESLGIKNYKTSAKLKKFVEEFKSNYKRDKDGNGTLKVVVRPLVDAVRHFSFPVTVTENDII